MGANACSGGSWHLPACGGTCGELEDREWERHTCEDCGGHGLTMDFDGGPTECSYCKGSGCYFISPKGRVADYPGGPFRGSVPLRKTA